MFNYNSISLNNHSIQSQNICPKIFILLFKNIIDLFMFNHLSIYLNIKMNDYETQRKKYTSPHHH